MGRQRLCRVPVAALLLLWLFTLPGTRARIVSLRVKNIASPVGFLELRDAEVVQSATCTAPSDFGQFQTGCISRCLKYTGAPASECITEVTPYCGTDPANKGDACIMDVELEGMFDYRVSSDSDHKAKMHTTAPPFINIQRIGNDVGYPSSTTARWKYRVSSALAGEGLVSFVAAQGNNERGIVQEFNFKCRPRPMNLGPLVPAGVSFLNPKVDCADGTIRVPVSVRGCPYLGENDSQRDYLSVFDLLADADAAGIHSGDPDADLAAVYPERGVSEMVEYGLLSFFNTTAAGKVELVMRRQRRTSEFPFPFEPAWPPKEGLKLGYRYKVNMGTDWNDALTDLPNANDWYLVSPPVLYEDKDNDGYSVKTASTAGTCDCDDNDPLKQRAC